MKRKVVLWLSVLCSAYTLSAQQALSIEEAIKTALEKNYAVLRVRNQQEISKRQNNAGNAGMSPTVSLNANMNIASLNSHQEFNTGAVQDRNGAKSSNIGSSLNASWVVFDGLKMFAIKKRLELNEQASSLVLKQQMENTIYTVMNTYYTITKLKQLQKASLQNLQLYEERTKIANLRFTIGSASKVDVLLTQAQLNKAKSDLLQYDLQLLTAKMSLAVLLNAPADSDYLTSDSMVVYLNPVLEDLKREASVANSSLLLSKQNEGIFQQSVLEAKSNNLPFVQLNGAYNFTRNSSEAGIVFLNQQNGLNAGFTASWLLFNGNKNNKLIQERNLLLLNQKYVSQEIQQQLDAEVFIKFQAFMLHKKIVSYELQSLNVTKELSSLSMERYKTGKADLIETMEVQKQLEEAQTRYVNALFALKMAETDLLKAKGSLIK